MLEKVHEHITSELNQSVRTDTIFVITAIAFNLIVLGINSGVAGEANNPYNSRDTTSSDIVMSVFIALTLLVNFISVTALMVGKQTRGKLLNGLLKMYEENGVSQYYDASLLTNYDRRYKLFSGVILGLAVTAIVVPLVVRLL